MNHKGHEGHKGHEELGAPIERLCREIVDSGLKFHRALGPGLLESVYEHCLAHELASRRIPFTRQVPLPVIYETTRLEAAYRMDLVVDDAVIIEIKAVEALTRLHEAQVLTYLKLSGHWLAFLINFNVERFKYGIRRLAL